MTGARRVYLDWNASAPLRPEAKAALIDALDLTGNPSSQHSEGRRARAAIERAREQVARLVGAEPAEVVFTSGATEAANQALRATPWRALRLSRGEHAAVLEAACAQGGEPGCALDWADPRPDGALDAARMARPFEDEGPALLVGAAAQGETGAAEPPGALCDWARAAGARAFCDATQLAGKAAFAAASGAAATYRFETEYAALSAHKFGGPRGVGALLARDGLAPEPLIRGGGQELRRRSGTENLAGIVAMGAAAEAAAADFARGVWESVLAMRRRLEVGVREARPDAVIHAEAAPWRLANTLSLAAPGLRAETLLMRLDLSGFAVSAGSACSSGKMSPSPVLAAMGVAPEIAAATIRISFGPATTEAEIDAFLAAWARL
ncbi:MAG: aminotransferase class V-fold PLP-dependent enzyme [Pseudomonadota bacterium]